MSSPTRALVTGGAGFIGSHLAEALLDRGYQVTVIDALTTGSFANIQDLESSDRFRFAIDTITNEVVMDRLVSECDVIFHLAAAVGVELIVRNPVEAIETNILGTHAVLKLASRYRKKVLLASTSEIYGKNSKVPFQEEDDRLLGTTTKERWSYSTSKAIDEYLGLAYHRQTNLPVVIFRLFNTIGPRQSGRYGMVVPRFVEQAMQGEALTIYGDGQQSRCFCDIEDAIRAIIGLAESEDAVGQVFNVGSTNEVTIQEMASEVLNAAGAIERNSRADDRVVYVPYEIAYQAGFEDMRRRVPDISKIKAAIGWQPEVSLDESLQRIVAWYGRDGRPLKHDGTGNERRVPS